MQVSVNGSTQTASLVSDGPEVAPTTVIEAAGAGAWINLRELWRARELMFYLAWRDVKVRYKQTVLGAAWAVLQPAMWMVVFTMFIGHYAGGSTPGDLPYPVFVLAGVVPWTFFATAVTSASNSVVTSERFITKIYFPRLVIPFAAVGSGFVDFAISFTLLAGVGIYAGIVPTGSLLLTPLIFALIVMAALGLGTWLAALNVAYRDVRHAVPFLVQIGMFATPTIYSRPAENAGGLVHALMLANPMTTLIAAFRASITGGEIDFGSLAVAVFVVAALLITGCLYFRRMEDQFADII